MRYPLSPSRSMYRRQKGRVPNDEVSFLSRDLAVSRLFEAAIDDISSSFEWFVRGVAERRKGRSTKNETHFKPEASYPFDIA